MVLLTCTSWHPLPFRVLHDGHHFLRVMSHQVYGCLKVHIWSIHIESLVNHQLGALHGAAPAGAVQCRLLQAVQSRHIGPSLDQGQCTPDGSFV